MFEWVLILVLIIILLIVFYKYLKTQGTIEHRSREIFEAWRKSEREEIDRWKETQLLQLSNEKACIQFEKWRLESEEIIRKDAIKRSQSVTRGRVTECLIPFFPEFPYNPKDARFLGTPVDLIVFDGLSDGEEVKDVIFIEIKTGKTAHLSPRERAVRDCIRDGRVQYSVIHQSFDQENSQFTDFDMR
ncbi:MAG: Holliday junction resolvase [Methanocalculus sp. MSAO_Arc2]|uniref:Holliday junction resolvase-like protein n=1 Tax=Methanocalculus sp. MSAO_Arc2 TaxID=2293855 RepID=UPI000FF33775|nr:MAG: Holliday junction resolvase [Methanocalculus sp. MSAO_Arc2]